MFGRIRKLAGVLTLLALTALMAEGVSAALCAPFGADGAMVMQSLPDAEAPAPHGEHDPRPDRTDPCPLAPIGGSAGCLVVASLPSTAPTDPTEQIRSAALGAFHPDHATSSPAAPPYHPPRA